MNETNDTCSGLLCPECSSSGVCDRKIDPERAQRVLRTAQAMVVEAQEPAQDGRSKADGA